MLRHCVYMCVYVCVCVCVRQRYSGKAFSIKIAHHMVNMDVPGGEGRDLAGRGLRQGARQQKPREIPIAWGSSPKGKITST